MTKISLGAFLCLSLFMLSCSLIRVAGMYNQSNGALDVPWGVFWIHAEACIGVVMGSITVYRSALLGRTNASNNFRRFLNKFIRVRTSECVLEEPQKLPIPAKVGSVLLSTIPNDTPTCLATQPVDQGRTLDGKNTTSTIRSAAHLEETDYHVFLRQQEAQQEEHHYSAKTQRTLQEASCSQESME